MYQIIAYDSPTDKTGHVVFDPRVNRYISDGKLNLKESEIDDLSLTVNQANYLFGNVRPLQTHVEVYQDNSLLFRGRALDLTREMKDSGQFVQSFVFESVQNYLQDTSQRWAKVQNTTPKQFFQRLIDTHNSQVPNYKKFTVRNVDVTNSTDNVYRYIEDGATTWDTIKDKLVSRLGGLIRVEHVDGVNYIDYLQNPGKEHPNDTPIRIGKNLQSASVQVDPTEVITQLVPLGATIENNNTTTDTEVSQPRIDIKSVNGGQDYLDIPDLQAEFGIIRKSVQWDDVHEPKILLTKAKQWIQAQSSAKESWTVNALELPDLKSFKISDRYLFNNQAVASPQLLRVTGKSIDLSHWQKSTLTIAEKPNSLTRYQLDLANALKGREKIKNQIMTSVNGQVNKINGSLNDQNKEIEAIKNQYKQTKKVAILGDSYSTFKGWNPEGNEIYFDGQRGGITNVDQTWWFQVLSAMQAELFLNESYSGSTISSTGRDGADMTATSFLTRGLDKFGQSSILRAKPNIIIIYGGLNDTFINSPVGSTKYDNWVTADYRETLPAFCKLVNDLKKYNSNARIINIISDLVSEEITSGMTEACQHYNILDIRLTDLETVSHHPTVTGMEQIATQIISAFEKEGIISG